MTIEVIGASHASAPLEVRERLALAACEAAEKLPEPVAATRLRELVIVSTCNRVEFYFRPTAESENFGHYLAAKAGLTSEEVRCHLYHLKGADAAGHLFSVAAGLDSMVLGETEVLAQVKSAYEAARAAGATGAFLNALFQRAFTAAKRVHSATGVSRGRTSVGSVLAALLKRELGTLSGGAVLVIGAGAMAENALAHISQLDCSDVVVANRSPRRGISLAKRFNGRAIGLSGIDDMLCEARVAVASTSGPGYILTKNRLAAVRERRSRPLLLLDISVPRTVEPAAGEIDGIRLFNIDDLKVIAEANKALRRGELEKARTMVDAEVAAFEAWFAEREVVPVVRELKKKARADADTEVDAALRNISRGSSPEAEIRKLARRLTNKFLHGPLSALKEAATDDQDAETLAGAAKRLHGIGDDGQT